jgi:hypothetical protein
MRTSPIKRLEPTDLTSVKSFKPNGRTDRIKYQIFGRIEAFVHIPFELVLHKNAKLITSPLMQKLFGKPKTFLISIKSTLVSFFGLTLILSVC